MIKSYVLPGHIAYLRSIEQITSGKQNAFYKWLIDTIKEICCMSPVPEGLHIASKRKQRCFSNSARMTINNMDITYVEGYLDCDGMYIEHAWNRAADGTYFDVTIKDKTMKYYPVLELDFHTVLDMIEHNDDRFGPFTMRYFYKNIYKP